MVYTTVCMHCVNHKINSITTQLKYYILPKYAEIFNNSDAEEILSTDYNPIADNFTNKILTGELFEIKGDMLKVVSSDGLRISLRKINLLDLLCFTQM